MRVKSITVKGLFGVFDHEIPLQSAERVTIIHGPNGFGKTMMLKMIAALVEGETYIFEHTPFTEFCLTFEDGTARIIRRRVAEKSESGKREVELEFLTRDSSGNTETMPPSPAPSDLSRNVLSLVDKLGSYPKSVMRVEGL
jgi:predicted ATP-binding protein involved in virulence